MVAAYAEPHSSGLGQVTCIGIVHQRSPLGGLEVSVGNGGAARHLVPVDAALVVRHIDALLVLRVDAGVRSLDEHRRRVFHFMRLDGLQGQSVRFVGLIGRHTLSFVPVFLTRLDRLGQTEKGGKCHHQANMEVRFEHARYGCKS